ncbi:MAG: RNase adapter RapZ [Desulfobacteraceae bacterium]
MRNHPIYIITGLSGSGKSTAIDAFEDAGFYCVDNMPMELIPKFLSMPVKSDPEVKGFAFVMDMRAKSFISRYASGINSLRDNGIFPTIIFLEAAEDTLVNRFSETRRHHPVAAAHDAGLMEGIRQEMEIMVSIKKKSDIVIDTTDFNVHKLKSVILDIIHGGKKDKSLMKIHIISFGFKYGIPSEADLVWDMRFLPNPFFIPDLKNQDGESSEVMEFVLADDSAGNFLEKYLDLLDYVIPLYRKENKAYLTIAVGCTGGRHRSVAIARQIFEHLNSEKLMPGITHRDIHKDVKEK